MLLHWRLGADARLSGSADARHCSYGYLRARAADPYECSAGDTDSDRDTGAHTDTGAHGNGNADGNALASDRDAYVYRDCDGSCRAYHDAYGNRYADGHAHADPGGDGNQHAGDLRDDRSSP